jgi:hypothetical protein
MNIALVAISWLLTIFLTLVYTKAGSFKLKGNMEQFAEAGFGWAKPVGLTGVRIIGFLELLGAYGLIAASVAFQFVPGFAWAQWFAVAAAAGLTLVMLVAIIMHIARGEFKYTYKMNLPLFFAALIPTIALSLVTLPLI